jgi:hypothetical protein
VFGLAYGRYIGQPSMRHLKSPQELASRKVATIDPQVKDARCKASLCLPGIVGPFMSLQSIECLMRINLSGF